MTSPNTDDVVVTSEPATIRVDTNRLRLVVPEPGMAARMVRYLLDNRSHTAFTSPDRPDDYYDVDQWTARLEGMRADAKAGRSLPFVMLSADDPAGPVLGQLTFSGIVRGPFQACYLGFAVDKQHEGQGLMYETLDAANRYVFDEMKLHRIMANYLPTNERSGRLLRRLGFTVEGYARDYLHVGGEWKDHVLTSLTNHGGVSG